MSKNTVKVKSRVEAKQDLDQTQNKLSDKLREMKRINVPIRKLMLDPNNPRLRTADVRRRTSSEYVSSDAVQRETEKQMELLNRNAMVNLYSKIRREGLIQSLCGFHVAELPGGNYVLCDGNTRVTALRKLIREIEEKKVAVPEDIENTWKNGIEVYVVGKYDEHDRDFMLAWSAIRSKLHIVGPKAWGPFQKCAFHAALRDSGLNLDEIAAVIGSRTHGGAGSNPGRHEVMEAIMAYDLFQSARKLPKYGDRIVNDGKFFLFKDAISNGETRTFLKMQAKRGDGLALCKGADPKRLEMFIKLMYPDTGKAYLGGQNSLHKLRALKDRMEYWEAALEPKENKRFLAQLVGIETSRNINELAEKFYGRLRDIRIEEIEQLNPKLLGDIVRVATDVHKKQKVLVRA